MVVTRISVVEFSWMSPVDTPQLFDQRYIRRNIPRLNPCASVFLPAVPFMLAEPLKLAAVFIFGGGHLVAGLMVMLSAYLVSALLVARLFEIVKPKLLLSRFVVIWKQFVETRRKAFRWLKSNWSRKRIQHETLQNFGEKRPRLESPKCPQAGANFDERQNQLKVPRLLRPQGWPLGAV